jgi:oligopeptide/dipeptide ABC transporter ATP-binding protein
VEHRREHVASKLTLREGPGADTGTIPGCRFHPRCPLGEHDVCRTVDPPLHETQRGHAVACHFPQSKQSLLAAAERTQATP